MRRRYNNVQQGDCRQGLLSIFLTFADCSLCKWYPAGRELSKPSAQKNFAVSTTVTFLVMHGAAAKLQQVCQRCSMCPVEIRSAPTVKGRLTEGDLSKSIKMVELRQNQNACESHHRYLALQCTVNIFKIVRTIKSVGFSHQISWLCTLPASSK